MKGDNRRGPYAQLIHQFFSRFDAEDVDGLLDLFCGDATLTMPLYDAVVRGREELRTFFQAHMKNWHQHREWPTNIIIDGNRAASELHFEGITLGGAKIVMDNLNIFEFDQGRIRAIRVYADTREFRRLLNAPREES